MCLSCVFYSTSADHRTLHSFPTRRSSDLLIGVFATTPTLSFAALVLGTTGALSAAAPFWQLPTALLAGTAAAGGRSEEHTSELQSRRDLVCRLLLEKKKKQSEFHLTAVNS